MHISLPGDVIIGALFKIHELTEDGSSCTSVTDGAAIQRGESLLYAINRMNKQDIVPGVKFGKFRLNGLKLNNVAIYYTCVIAEYAL